MPERQVIVLMYHELEQSGRSLCSVEPGYVRYVLRAEDFRRQMEFIRERGWRGVGVGEAVRFDTDRAVGITFDDGSETDLLCAAPVLQRYGFGATFYVTAQWLGQRGHLNHEQLRELSALGFEIGCHSMTHAYLTDLDEAGLRREMVEARLQLERIIGKAVEHFSCPGGRFDQRVVTTAREAGYRTLATSEVKANSQSGNRLALGRVAIMRSTSLSEFEEFCSGRQLWRSRVGLQVRAAGKKMLGNSLYDRVRNALLGRTSA